ncbi:hypothetical protein RIF29_16821 [Crotalaria pallida]|uniref:Uncharacterized protein n=1 Tax=Crotalaria pallida TaxID=3830 RepID=A0AAN9FG78_CROPI
MHVCLYRQFALHQDSRRESCDNYIDRIHLASVHLIKLNDDCSGFACVTHSPSLLSSLYINPPHPSSPITHQFHNHFNRLMFIEIENPLLIKI